MKVQPIKKIKKVRNGKKWKKMENVKNTEISMHGARTYKREETQLNNV